MFHKKEKNEFSVNIQLLKFCLSILVLFSHVFLSFKAFIPLLVIPINTFAIISGYMLLFKNNKFRAIKFIPTILFLWIINIFLFIVFALIFNYFNKLNWTAILLTGNNWTWWYLSAITIVYIFSPILNYIILNTNKYILLIIIFSIWLVFQIICYFLTSEFLWMIPLFYCYLIGGFLKIYVEDYIKNKSYKFIIAIMSLLIFCIMIILNVVYLTILKSNPKLNFLAINANNSPGVVLLACSFFLFFLTIDIKNYRLIFFLGDLSLFIFAYHVFFINFINITDFTNNNIIIIFFVLLATIVLSLILYFPFLGYKRYTESWINIFLSYKWVNNNILLLNSLLFVIMFGFYLTYFII